MISCGALLLKCGETVLPKVVVARRLKIYLEDDLERHFPSDRWVRVLAHPTRLPAHTAPCAGEGGASAAGAEIEASVDDTGKLGQRGGAGSDGAETMPVPGLRFSQVEPPKGVIRDA